MAGSRTSPGLKDERSITQERQKYRAPVRELFAEHKRGANRARGRHRPNPSTHPSRSPLPTQKGTPPRQGSNVGRRTSSHPFSAPRKSPFAKSQSRPENRDVRESQESNSTALLDSTAGGSVAQEFSSQRSCGRSPEFRHRESLPRRDTGNRSKGHQNQQDKILDPDLHRPRSSGDRSYENRENSQRQRQHLSPSPHRQNFNPDSASQRSLSPQHSEQGHSSFVSPRRGGNMDKTGSDSAAIKSRHSSPSLWSNPLMKREGHNVFSDNQQNSGSSTKHNTINTKPDFDMRDAPTGPRADRQNLSFHGSYLGTSEPSSPYSNGRVGRNKHNGGDSGPLFDYSSSNRSPNHSNSSQRGSFHRAAYHDRRHASQGSSGFNASNAHRERGNFNSHQWVPKGPRDQEGPDRSPNFPDQSGSNTPQYQDSQMNERSTLDTRQDDRSRFSDDMKKDATQDQSNVDNGNTQAMPPPPRESGGASSTPAKESGKFSFAFKAKTNPPPATKPVPDLAQRMQTREPPRGPAPRPSEPAPRNRLSCPPPPSKYKQDYRHDRRERDRDNYRGRGRDDRRDFPARNARDNRRDDHRFDSRDLRRRDDPRSDFRHERRKDRSPEPKRQKRLVQRVKPRQILAEEYRDSDSVYFRKPGDESVIGAGTYGKVFKAIHVYTQDKVALKRIRMEGEKDGFPVTAVREIKLLQHLRHHNVVSLLEVMVEKNECFMVFEYLSHDLTGLINHPTFTLTPAHKKDLAKQMFDGLAYLHHRGVLHRDIKAANILISNRGQLKYADFGLARFFSKSRQLDYTNRVITIWYRPPELLLGDTRYGPAVDVWSAACVFMEMFTKKAVFPGDGKELSQLDKLYSILGTPTRAEWPGIVDMPWVELMGPTERKKRVFENTYREFLSPDALDLMCRIFQYDPARRPTADEVLAHAYFATEEPGPQQATELENIEGDWHEFESKALRKEREREAREARKDRDREKEKEKRRASIGPPQENERGSKRLRQEDASVRQQG